jgi:hypothetical protein
MGLRRGDRFVLLIQQTRCYALKGLRDVVQIHEEPVEILRDAKADSQESAPTRSPHPDMLKGAVHTKICECAISLDGVWERSYRRVEPRPM